MSYDTFRQRPLFQEWEGQVPGEMIAASRKIMLDTAGKLEALGPEPDREQARGLLRDCIVAFNQLDEANDHWITTLEREDICACFDQLAELAGVEDEPELADEWRDW